MGGGSDALESSDCRLDLDSFELFTRAAEPNIKDTKNKFESNYYTFHEQEDND